MIGRTYRPALVVLAVVCLAASVAPGAVGAGPCWHPPVSGPVVDPFREPPCRWCAGNRGLEYRVAAGSVVRAVAAGTVTFAGSVAGIGYVVVGHPDGRRVTYGRLVQESVRRGDTVVAGSRIGRASERFHLGVRIDGRYVDPAPLVGRVEGRPRLVPTDGTPARPGGRS